MRDRIIRKSMQKVVPKRGVQIICDTQIIIMTVYGWVGIFSRTCSFHYILQQRTVAQNLSKNKWVQCRCKFYSKNFLSVCKTDVKVVWKYPKAGSMIMRPPIRVLAYSYIH